jgi:hypothetical protein
VILLKKMINYGSSIWRLSNKKLLDMPGSMP